MTLSTITISAVDYVSYASVAEADPYLAIDAVRAAVWAALTTDEKGAKLVAATRRLNLLSYGGEKTSGDTQDDKFPRTGLTYASGGAVSTTEVPQGVEDATILLAGSIAIEPEAGDAGTSGTNVKSVKAGSTAVDFFRLQTGVPLQDTTAYSLIKEFLSASGISSDTGALVSGNGDESSFDDIDEWGLTNGFP